MVDKNILIIGNYPPPYGGVPHHIERLSEYLADRGWNCHILSGGTSGNESIGKVSVYKPTYLRKIIAFIRQIFDTTFEQWLEDGSLKKEDPKFWARYKMYADVGARIIQEHNINLVVSYNMLTYAPIGAWLAEKFGIPHITNVFGEIYKFESMSRNQFFFQRVAQTAARMLSCSSHCGASVKILGIDTPVQTVTYGIDLKNFTPGDAPLSLRKRMGLDSSPVVLFVGRLSREMGLDSFIDAARKVVKLNSDIRFVMVGQDGDLVDEVQQECDMSDGVFTLVRNAPYSELPDYYRLADVVVVPTRGSRTCSSLAAMEAMASQKPVVCYAIGGIPEIIENERTGLLVEPEDTEALSVAIMRLIDDEYLSESIAEAGYRHALNEFGEKLVNTRMENHYMDVLSNL